MRRLYQGHEADITSLAVEGKMSIPLTGPVKEHIVYAAPATRGWMRWKLRDAVIYLREHTFVKLTLRRMRV